MGGAGEGWRKWGGEAFRRGGGREMPVSPSVSIIKLKRDSLTLSLSLTPTPTNTHIKYTPDTDILFSPIFLSFLIFFSLSPFSSPPCKAPKKASIPYDGI